jgi:uncharacterized circularly permuted ATP-grasp superfamily protein
MCCGDPEAGLGIAVFGGMQRLPHALRFLLASVFATALFLPTSASARDLTKGLSQVVKLVESKGTAKQASDLRTIIELQGKGAIPLHKSFVDAALGGDAVKNLERQIKFLGKHRKGRPAVTQLINDLQVTKAEFERSGYMNFGSPSNPEPSSAVILGKAKINSPAYRNNVKALAASGKVRLGNSSPKLLSSNKDKAAYLLAHYRKLGLSPTLQAVKVDGKTQHNVAVTIPGTSRDVIALTANYGNAMGKEGAAANAGLMEAGRSLAKGKFGKTIKLVHTISGDTNPDVGRKALKTTNVQAVLSLGAIGKGSSSLNISAGKGEVSAYLGSELARASNRLNGKLSLTSKVDSRTSSKSGVARITISGAGSGTRWSAVKSAQAVHAAIEATARMALPKALGKQAGVQVRDLGAKSVYGQYKGLAAKAKRGTRVERDELLDKKGNIRPHYQDIARKLSKTSASTGNATARQMQKDAKDQTEFKAYPRVISEKEFSNVEKGLKQLERVMQAALKDIYSSNSILLKKGIITKAELKAAEGYDSWYKDVHTRRTKFDFVVRPDMIRGQDGRLKVIEVNQGYVGGIGDIVRLRKLYKANNPGVFEGANIRSTEGFHFELGNHLKSMSPKKNPKVIFYTPGSTDQGVDNEDRQMAKEFKRQGIDYITDSTKKKLKTIKGKVYVVEGSKRELVDVVYSRKDSNSAAMETAHANGAVKIFPTPGSSVFESKSLFNKFPQMIKVLLKERPILDYVTTKNFASKKGGALDRGLLAKVMKNPSKYVIKVANEAQGEGILVGKDASRAELKRFQAKIMKNPHNWTVQEFINPTTYNGQRVDFNPYLVSIKGKHLIPPGAMVRTANLKGAKFGDNPKFMDVWVKSSTKRRDFLKNASSAKTKRSASSRTGRVAATRRAVQNKVKPSVRVRGGR